MADGAGEPSRSRAKGARRRTRILQRLPNASRKITTAPPLPGGRLMQRPSKLSLRGSIGGRLEHRAHRLAKTRLAAHHARHDSGVPDKVVERFEQGVELRFRSAPLVDQAMTKARDTSAC